MTKDRTDQLKNEMAKDFRTNKYKFWTKDEKIEEDLEDEQVALTGIVIHPTIKRGTKKEEGTLNDIFQDVQNIKDWLQQIKDDTALLKKCQLMVQESTRPESGMKDKIEDIKANIKSTSVKVRTALQALEKKKEETDNAINKVVITQHLVLTKDFYDTMGEYQQGLLVHRKICEDIIKKQLIIVIQMVIRRVTCVPADREVSTEELMAILQAEDPAIFVDNYMKETLEARLLLQSVQARYQEILKIEQDILQLHDLFAELSMHVTQQGDTIDTIEYHIIDTYTKAEKGKKKLKKAEKFKSKARKKKVWILLIVLLVILVIVLILFLG